MPGRTTPSRTMTRRLMRLALLGVVALAAAAGIVWIAALPPARAPGAGPPVPAAETEAALAALKPPKRPRPVVAVIGLNDATETTDYLMAYGILKRSGVADVAALATRPGTVALYPALKVEPDATVAEFDARHPDGADYVVVPAMSRDDDPAVLQWLRSQAAKGAVIVSVCAGAKVVAAAGLLDGRQATTHWYFLKGLREQHPEVRYVADRRLVVDRGVATTTGISASMPMMLTLVEAIAGRDKAEAVAADLGVASWDARHDSAAFGLNRPFALTVIGNLLAFWTRERLGIALAPGLDEVSLALLADGWSRTYRSQAVTFAGTPSPVETRGGLRVVPDEVTADWPAERLAPPIGDRRPAEVLDQTLRDIAARYGGRTADVVAMQLEYPKAPAE